MNVIEEKIEALQTFSDNLFEYIRLEVIDDEAIIADMNAQVQLYEQGVYTTGEPISDKVPYTSTTIQVKLAKGQPTNRVTLKDEGDFHASFRVIADDVSFFIDATDWKASKLAEKYGFDIFGLTDENLNELIWEYIYPCLINKANELL
ncbi:MAG: hypothetical protein RR490_07830 [Niameybacter sp.]